MNVLALIPARSGSKSIPHKNIMSIFGKPMLAYSIEHAKNSKYVNRIIVSTDSEYYAQIAKEHGAEVPFIRPAEISADDSKDIDVFIHALEYLSSKENYKPDIIVHLRPTYPVRNSEDIDNMIKILMDDQNLDSVRSITENPEPVFKMWFRDEDGKIKPVVTIKDNPEAYNTPRQYLPKSYIQNACIDVTRYDTIMNKNSMTGSEIHGYVMNEFHDIDYFSQVDSAKKKIALNGNGEKRFCVDIDGVVAHLTPNNDYEKAEPISENIKKINKLYDSGNYIVLFTARGSKTGINWEEKTKKQLDSWGVKYNELKFGKPAADFYIDDRHIGLEDLNLN